MAHCAENDSCTICNEQINIFSIGGCNHPICFKCSTKMRFLCKQMYCPICRASLPQVVFVNKEEKYENIDKKSFLICHKTKIFSESELIYAKWHDLLSNNCKLCTATFDTFSLLKRHMSENHSLHSCNICEKHLMLFSYERKFYDRQTLARHKKSGDDEDPSYKGHPLCKFCDVRYFDSDELVLHLRKDHYFCHICEADGFSNEFYCDYPELFKHFKVKHFVCMEGNCATAQWSNVFRNEIDMNIHIATHHSNSLNKNHARQLRQINVDFNYKKYKEPRNRREGNYEHEGFGRQHEINSPSIQSYDDLFPNTISKVSNAKTNYKENITALSSSKVNAFIDKPYNVGSNANGYEVVNNKKISNTVLDDSDFPSLSNNKPLSDFKISSWTKNLSSSTVDDFPALVSSNKSINKSIPKNHSLPNFNYSAVASNQYKVTQKNEAPTPKKNKKKLYLKHKNVENNDLKNKTLSDLAKNIHQPIVANIDALNLVSISNFDNLTQENDEQNINFVNEEINPNPEHKVFKKKIQGQLDSEIKSKNLFLGKSTEMEHVLPKTVENNYLIDKNNKNIKVNKMSSPKKKQLIKCNNLKLEQEKLPGSRLNSKFNKPAVDNEIDVKLNTDLESILLDKLPQETSSLDNIKFSKHKNDNDNIYTNNNDILNEAYISSKVLNYSESIDIVEEPPKVPSYPMNSNIFETYLVDNFKSINKDQIYSKNWVQNLPGNFNIEHQNKDLLYKELEKCSNNENSENTGNLSENETIYKVTSSNILNNYEADYPTLRNDVINNVLNNSMLQNMNTNQIKQKTNWNNLFEFNSTDQITINNDSNVEQIFNKTQIKRPPPGFSKSLISQYHPPPPGFSIHPKI